MKHQFHNKYTSDKSNKKLREKNSRIEIGQGKKGDDETNCKELEKQTQALTLELNYLKSNQSKVRNLAIENHS